jgi:hypothetical protein
MTPSQASRPERMPPTNWLRSAISLQPQLASFHNSVGMGRRPAKFHENPRIGRRKRLPHKVRASALCGAGAFACQTMGFRWFFEPVRSPNWLRFVTPSEAPVGFVSQTRRGPNWLRSATLSEAPIGFVPSKSRGPAPGGSRRPLRRGPLGGRRHPAGNQARGTSRDRRMRRSLVTSGAR